MKTQGLLSRLINPREEKWKKRGETRGSLGARDGGVVAAAMHSSSSCRCSALLIVKHYSSGSKEKRAGLASVNKILSRYSWYTQQHQQQLYKNRKWSVIRISMNDMVQEYDALAAYRVGKSTRTFILWLCTKAFIWYNRLALL